MEFAEYAAMIFSYVVANLISMYLVYRLKGKKLIKDLFLNENI